MISALLLSKIVLAGALSLNSSSIQEGKTIKQEQVFNGFGCSGKNISPQLKWSKGPSGTKFYAVTMYDPDAPTGSGWWHWIVLNIPANINELEEGASGKSLPVGAIETRTDFGKAGYGGPCPPQGDKAHRYIFKVYALKDKISLEADAPGAMAGFYVNSLKLAEGKLQGKFSR